MASSRKVAPEDRLRAVLGPHLAASARVTVAYSGGLDSSVLLHLLARSGLPGVFQAVHVHHGLSPHADAWATHCRRICQELKIPLQERRVRVIPAGQGIEAAAREARYQAFAMLETDLLLLAHQRDDQAETVLLQCLRGGGLRGLAAMPAQAQWGRITVLRPLLECTRAELEHWARAQGLRWIEDESNNDPSFTRNRLRHQLLPELERHSPGIAASLAARAGQFAEWAGLLDQLAAMDALGALDAEGLSLPRLAALARPRAANLLRFFLEQRGVPIRQHALNEALEQLLHAVPAATPRIDFGAVSLFRHHERVQVAPRALMDAPVWEEPVWSGESELDLPPSGRLRFHPAVGAGVRLEPGRTRVQRRRGGERLHLRPDAPGRTLKNLLRESGIPSWLRAHLPLVYVRDRLAWVAHLGAEADFLARPGEPGWLIDWEPSPTSPPPPPR
ncbi:MAG: tRNA lysidine(34) synthetase TilS [Betaproteobacteria bacterium]|nr:tRNA lysidine(34) synthetase TilS [Betaproteobacteria bacterium]